MGGDDGEMTDDTVFYFSQLDRVYGKKMVSNLFEFLLRCFDAADSFDSYLHTHNNALARTAACRPAHMTLSAARLSQTVGNPPPLKQKDLFLSRIHARVSVVFSAENISLIPADLCRVTEQWVGL